MLSKYLISTNAQKVLGFLLINSSKACYEREVARGAKISYGSANHILNQLRRKGLIQRKTEGRMCYYSIDKSNPYLKELKNLGNILLVEPLVEKLKPYAHKVILYGSWAEGTDTEESDIDLFIVSSDEDKVKSIIDKHSYSNKTANRKIQAIISSPAALLSKDKRDKVFMDQVKRGKTLWEREIDEDNL
ncbi:MAG: nucleotidyltransferase domain-containing protein [Candidatus Omnitrophota bacterium]